MSQANPIITTFNAGELSPLVGGRPDLAKYAQGLQVCRNFIPRVQGALTRRGGTRFVAEVKDSGARTWLARFVFAANDAFVLEFGNNNIRFHRNRGVLKLDPDDLPADWSDVTAYKTADLVRRSGVYYYCKFANTGADPATDAIEAHWHPLVDDIYEIPSPYDPAITKSARDGSFAIRYTQSGDVIYLTHPSIPPQKLTRRGTLDWVMTPFQPDGGPFDDQNEDEAIKVRATAVEVGDETTIEASAAIFTPDHEGTLFYIAMQDGGSVKPWEVYQPVPVSLVNNARRSSDGKYYLLTAVGGSAKQYTGTEKPIHTQGRFWDGDGLDKDTDDNMGSLGAEWEYLHSGYGWVRIDEYVSPTQVSGHVVSRLPEEVVSVTSGDFQTWRWAHAAWLNPDKWPSSVAFFRDRLAFGQGQTVWFSQAGDYENFKTNDFGEQLPSSAFEVLVQSGHGDPVEWLVPTQKLLAGTGGSVHAIGEAATNQAFGPANARQEDQVMPGSSGVQPVLAGAVLYAETSGRILNAAGFSAEDNKFTAQDLTVFAEHITRSGVIGMAFAKQPHAVNWCVRADGGLAGLTYHKDQQVIGWHEQAIGGRTRPHPNAPDQPAVVEDICVIPAPDGGRDDVWLIVRRTIAGVTRRYVEYIVPEYQDGDDPALAAYSDCHLIYSGAPTSVVAGLDHLAGETVQIKADGAAHPDKVVVQSGGDWLVELDAPASKVVVGLAAPARARLMPLEAGATLGTSQARIKRVNRATFRLVSSMGGAVGPDFDALAPLEYRTPTGGMDAPPAIFTGDKLVEFPGDYDSVATIAVECDQGFPFTLVAIMPELTTYEG